jgi:hypothetical protein
LLRHDQVRVRHAFALQSLYEPAPPHSAADAALQCHAR